MIFLAVGTQLPFDRLTRALDQWCAENGKGPEVFGQVGQLGPENYTPQHFEWQSQIGPDTFNEKMESADIIVGHAGMGTIITALCLQKPVVIMARRAHLQEQRNDHQFATVKHFGDKPGVFPLQREGDLAGVLDDLIQGAGQTEQEKVSRFAEGPLIAQLRDFIYTGSNKP